MAEQEAVMTAEGTVRKVAAAAAARPKRPKVAAKPEFIPHRESKTGSRRQSVRHQCDRQDASGGLDGWLGGVSRGFPRLSNTRSALRSSFAA